MILLADSGSTKTDWALLSGHSDTQFFYTAGCNPYHGSDEAIFSVIHNGFPNHIDKRHVREIHFFGAGCGLTEKQQQIRNILKKIFPESQSEVYSDVHAAALALFGQDPGIACVIGTGANAVLWDGKKTRALVPSLGYILGDEGSGAWIGKKFITTYLRGRFEKSVQDDFRQKIQLSDNAILEKIYRSDESKQFLASMVPVMLTHIDYEPIQNIFREAFDQFFNTFLPEKTNTELQTGFCGSVAFHLKHILLEVAQGKNIPVSRIIEKPLNVLTEIYKANL